ncbi:uncharacterized protein LOC132272056 [Cornus florida]|uniref:uncharacterized protein LOC132272056 n=1 Tax=Cornus florida TaxID=4283 RepID=UPI0028A2A1D7|nr:uncharacterized protein LOC132272056 [Cornus florida]
MMANIQGVGNNSSVLREYRRGNWTVQETMVLIEAKKMDDERRMKRPAGVCGDSSDPQGMMRISKPTELRWKWIEDFCWRNGCFRSQNQCNDKWDNLMRDFKKVRDYERRLLVVYQKAGEGDHDCKMNESSSYWKIERSERKERNLPSNMLPQIYEALVEVVERKGGGGVQRVVGSGGGGSISNTNTSRAGYVMEGPTISTVQPSFPPLLQHTISTPVALLPLPPPLQPPPPPPSQPHPISYSQPLPTVNTDTSEYSDSPSAKRRRRRRRRRGEGSSGTAASGSTISNEVSSAISRSATIIAEAIQACEEREERRHKDLLSLHERRLQIEESKTEINRQGINGLVDAVNKLANSIFTLATHKVEQSDPPQ